MSTNFIDVLMMWLGNGPSAPKYCHIVRKGVPTGRRFGDPVSGKASNALELKMQQTDRLAAPTNALVWRPPDVTASSPLNAEERREALGRWPPLRNLDGTMFTPVEARGDGIHHSLLLEVFPQAFRRLEFLFSSLEIPASIDDWDIPRTATPRWFWIKAFDETGIGTRFGEIATTQFQGHPAPTIDRFRKGLAPIYVNAGEHLGGAFEPDEIIEVRAFDSTGLPIDPEFVFSTFNRLGSDSDFESLKVPHPQGADPFLPEHRHVIVFCDQDGFPYTPRPAPLDPPPPGDPDAGVVEAERQLRVVSPSTAVVSFPENGVVVTDAASPLHTLSGRIGLALTGTHVRCGAYPNGSLGATTTVDFAPDMFLRLQVLDYRDWFRRSLNPRNRLARYTEGNLVTPLIDAADFFRELYRTIRATYKDIDPTLPAATFDPDAEVDDAPAASTARAKVLLSNAWIDPQTPLLGLRWLNAAPKTQDVLPEELPSFDILKSSVRFVAAAGFPGQVDLAALVADQRKWWMVSDDGVLPPGASVELRQLMFADTYHGDDPRLPGTMLNADLFGIVAPFPAGSGSSRGFASSSGRFVLPVIFELGRDPMATMRITVWQVDNGPPASRSYREIVLPSPGDPFTPIPFTGRADAGKLRLVYEGVPGRVVVVLDPAALADRQTVVVVNPRSAEMVIEEHDANPGGEIRIAVSGFALQDSALVGFLPPGGTDPAACTHFFDLFLGRLPTVPDDAIDATHADPANAAVAALEAGMFPAHPTEIAGLLREAIASGVDVRVLAWKDSTKTGRDYIVSSPGLANSLNATISGRRGQAVLDATGRGTFHVHHQKGSFIRTASSHFIAFLGGIDLVNGRWDTQAHRQPDPERPGSTWHDVQCKVEGKAAWDIYRNTMERWNVACALPDIVGADPGRTPLPPPDDPAWGATSVVDDPTMTKADGPHAVQVIRTLAPHFDAYGGEAPPFDIVEKLTGDLSVRNTWRLLLGDAQRFLYIEDQYFWIEENARDLHNWLHADAGRFVFLVMPRRFTDLPIGDQIHYALRRRCLSLLLCGIPDLPVGTDPRTVTGHVVDQVAMFHIVSRENLDPIYVHSKLAIADDTWFTIGSANLTRRSWTLDSEINVGCIDARLRRGGHLSARQLRIDLLAEHLQLLPVETPLVEDPRDAFRLVQDVLANKRSWMRTHLLKVDLDFTHYGPFPADFDPILRDAVALFVDTDGVERHFDFGPMDFAGFIEALRQAPEGLRYGGLARLRFTFDVSQLGMAPADLRVKVEMRQAAWPPAQRVTMGPWPATDPVDAGLLAVGGHYQIVATALSAATSAPVGQHMELPLHVTDFLNVVNLAFHL